MLRPTLLLVILAYADEWRLLIYFTEVYSIKPAFCSIKFDRKTHASCNYSVPTCDIKIDLLQSWMILWLSGDWYPPCAICLDGLPAGSRHGSGFKPYNLCQWASVASPAEVLGYMPLLDSWQNVGYAPKLHCNYARTTLAQNYQWSLPSSIKILVMPLILRD